MLKKVVKFKIFVVFKYIIRFIKSIETGKCYFIEFTTL